VLRPAWIEPPPHPCWTSDRFQDPLLTAILARRFATEEMAARFLAGTSLPEAIDECLPNMAAAVQRVSRAIADRERIVIFGDYDVDGIAAAAIMLQTLQAAGNGAVSLGVRLPSRTDGYGLRPDAVREIAASGTTLLITVDCGSSDHENVVLARNLGLDVVVLDHHQLTGPAVDAIVVSPQLAAGDQWRVLSAAGVVYLFAVALADAGFDLGAGPGNRPTHLLDLVSLGLVADVMPLSGIGRTLVRNGLAELTAWRRPGLRLLAQRAGIALDRVTSDDIAYRIAPRLNAAGRMDDPRLALSLLLTNDLAIAERRALKLEQLNQQRRFEADRIFNEALALIRADPRFGRQRVALIHAPGWHAGVLGVVAARLTESLGLPAVVLGDADGISRGSARSVPGFDIGRAIESSAELLIAHGGHDQAAGLTIETARIPALASALELAAPAELAVGGEAFLEIDADLPITRLDLVTVDALSVLEPFGAGNPRPLLRLQGARLASYQSLGQDGRHLKLKIATPRGEVGVLAWNAAHRSRELVGRRWLDLLITLGDDRWNGQRRLQPVLRDFRVLD
jgi:single-stranded-DNA-specific exonuclease